MRKRHQYALLATVLLSATAFTFGGWAIVTVDDVPEQFVVGKPTELSFIVRQHAVSPLGGLTPTVTMKSGSTITTAPVRAGKNAGYYVASLVAPRAGDWAVRIESGFGTAETKLLPTTAIAEGGASPAPKSEAERGHRLFNAKGCVSCHVRSGEGAEGYKMGPELTGRTYPAEVLAKFLRNPSANPITVVAADKMKMPQLELKEREVASLVAFINNTKQLSAK